MGRGRWFSRKPNESQDPEFSDYFNEVYHFNNLSTVLVFLLSFIICYPQLVSGAEAGRPKLIRGALTTLDGKPLAGATVEILDGSGRTLAQCVSDSKGEFAIETDAPPGEY